MRLIDTMAPCFEIIRIQAYGVAQCLSCLVGFFATRKLLRALVAGTGGTRENAGHR